MTRAKAPDPAAELAALEAQLSLPKLAALRPARARERILAAYREAVGHAGRACEALACSRSDWHRAVRALDLYAALDAVRSELGLPLGQHRERTAARGARG